MTRIKMCGLMSPGDVGVAVAAGADSLGFVTEYPIAVPWNLDRETAAELVATAPPFVTTTAVVGGAVDQMLAIARLVRPHFIQLHGDESLAEIDAVCAGLAGTGTRVIKALRVDVDSGQAQFEEPDPLRAVRALAATGIIGLVVDSKTASRPAGTGVALDWSLAARLAEACSKPFILAGGLNPTNVAQAVERVRPYGVDVISGVEAATSVKDGQRMRAFVTAVRGADARGPAP